jgi:hypothetical protein
MHIAFSTTRKQGHAMLAALVAVFQGHPLPIARGTWIVTTKTGEKRYLHLLLGYNEHVKRPHQGAKPAKKQTKKRK